MHKKKVSLSSVYVVSCFKTNNPIVEKQKTWTYCFKLLTMLCITAQHWHSQKFWLIGALIRKILRCKFGGVFRWCNNDDVIEITS